MNSLLGLLFATVGVIVIGTLLIWSIEGPIPESDVKTPLDALWWTVATITTVGYGDIELASDLGRVIALIYMFFGITMLAIFLSTVGTVFFKKRFESEGKGEILSEYQKTVLKKIEDFAEKQNADIKEIRDELKSIKEKID